MYRFSNVEKPIASMAVPFSISTNHFTNPCWLFVSHCQSSSPEPPPKQTSGPLQIALHVARHLSSTKWMTNEHACDCLRYHLFTLYVVASARVPPKRQFPTQNDQFFGGSLGGASVKRYFCSEVAMPGVRLQYHHAAPWFLALFTLKGYDSYPQEVCFMMLHNAATKLVVNDYI